MYLIDTNILILAIAGVEPGASFFKNALKRNRVILSVVVVAEFLSRPSLAEQEEFSKLINRLPIIEIKLSTAQLAGEFRRQNSRTKRSELLDCFLAAQAYENNLTIVTNNISDFRIKGINVVSPAQL